MPRAVLFDLDGTLLDHDAAVARALAAHLPAVLPDLAPARLAALTAEWRRLEELHFPTYLAGAVTLAEQRRRRVHGVLVAAGADPLDDAGADAWFDAFRSRYEAAWTAFGDAAATLAALAARGPQLALGVVTNGDAAQQRAKLAAAGLARWLPTLVASSEAGAAKPDAAIFRAACRRLGVAPREAAYVGDRLDVDALAAGRAGLRGVWLDRDGRGGAPAGVTAIANLGELPAALRLS